MYIDHWPRISHSDFAKQNMKDIVIEKLWRKDIVIFFGDLFVQCFPEGRIERIIIEYV